MGKCAPEKQTVGVRFSLLTIRDLFVHDAVTFRWRVDRFWRAGEGSLPAHHMRAPARPPAAMPARASSPAGLVDRAVYCACRPPCVVPEWGMQATLTALHTGCMTPHEARMMAAELLNRFDRLATLDLEPVTNGAELDAMRADAEDVARGLLAYLVTSDNFAPVTEEADAVQEWQLAQPFASECALTVWDEA